MKLRYTIFGESHGPAIGVVVENLPAGIPVDQAFLASEMKRRQARADQLTTSRIESDEPQILSGVYQGKTTGTPLCAVILNENTRSDDYREMQMLARPSHADYTGFVRYGGHNDHRGGGHFSGRLTAPLVFAGALAKLALRADNVFVGSHIRQIGPIQERPFVPDDLTLDSFTRLAEKPLPTLDGQAAEQMRSVILAARESCTSVGGAVECAIIGIPAGLGSPDEPTEARFSQALFRVPAVKGVAFGLGFGFAESYGHDVNDPMQITNGQVTTSSNYNGGILGGITNGMPILIQTVIKPTASISREQQTVNLQTMTEEALTVRGRHDPCILSRAAVVVEAAAALAALELIQDYRPHPVY